MLFGDLVSRPKKGCHEASYGGLDGDIEWACNLTEHPSRLKSCPFPRLPNFMVIGF